MNSEQDPNNQTIIHYPKAIKLPSSSHLPNQIAFLSPDSPKRKISQYKYYDSDLIQEVEWFQPLTIETQTLIDTKTMIQSPISRHQCFPKYKQRNTDQQHKKFSLSTSQLHSPLSPAPPSLLLNSATTCGSTSHLSTSTGIGEYTSYLTKKVQASEILNDAVPMSAGLIEGSVFRF